MSEEDFIEVEVAEFYNFVELALANGDQSAWGGCCLFNPITSEELKITNIEGGIITFEQSPGHYRKVPINVLSKWSALVPTAHVINQYKNKALQADSIKRELIEQLRNLGIPVNFELTNDEIKLIEKCWESDLSKTDQELRKTFYSSIKKLENYPAYLSDSFRIGRKILENWGNSSIKYLPADVLIHLAYYRRWSKDISAALEATECLEGNEYNNMLSSRERSILATERAAAFMDLYEKEGNGLARSLKFLQYSHAANGGTSSAENRMCWQRHDKLSQRN